MLVDDHAVVRAGYRRFLDAEPGFCVAAEAGSCAEAYARMTDDPVDVIVLDLCMPGGSSLDTLRRMLTRWPQLRALVFSMHDNPSYVTQAFRAGALGYLTKNSEPAEMLRAIRDVAAGRRFLSVDVAQGLAQDALDGESVLGCLTPREFEVLRFAAAGDSTCAIAERMHLSIKTVVNYLSLIRQKLGVDSDLELFRLAARHGLVDLSAMRSSMRRA
jgi:DNA-binding NarL/FixJ family response regulator